MSFRPNTFDTTLRGMLHKLKMIELITQNIGNSNSISYKRQIPESLDFNSVLNEVALRDNAQGQLKRSTSKFDLAIEGHAFFLIETKDGIQPVRNGNFMLNEKGNLATQDGNEVVIIERTEKPIALANSNDITVNQSGEIFVGVEKYGRIAMQIMDNKPVKVHQSFLENSNVDLANEMMSLTMVYRAVEASEKALGMEASIDKDLIEKYGRNV